MTAIGKFLSVGVVLAAFIAMPLASHAQAPASTLVKTASASSPAQKTGLAGKWTCISRATVEIAPVSYDTRGQANAWVTVYRDRGEIIASERVDALEVEQLRRLPCGTPDSNLGGVALVG
jgi:hypothetical protein